MRSDHTAPTTTRRAFLGLAGALGAAAATPQLAAAEADVAADEGQTVVYASSYGFDPQDSTDALQSALDSTADVVVFDNVGADWITRPLSVNRDNFTLTWAVHVN